MPSEWAMEKATEAVGDLLTFVGKPAYDMRDNFAEALDAARIEGLEQAAKIAELKRHVNPIGKVIAEDIRARIEEVKA